MNRLGFTRKAGRHFVHQTCPYTLEFPSWPLAVGNELVREWGERPVGALRIQILTPTQCAKDRLAAFYHWRDRQGLGQAVLVAAQQIVGLDEIERSSVREGHAEALREFAACVKKTRIGG